MTQGQDTSIENWQNFLDSTIPDRKDQETLRKQLFLAVITSDPWNKLLDEYCLTPEAKTNLLAGIDEFANDQKAKRARPC